MEEAQLRRSNAPPWPPARMNRKAVLVEWKPGTAESLKVVLHDEAKRRVAPAAGVHRVDQLRLAIAALNVTTGAFT